MIHVKQQSSLLGTEQIPKLLLKLSLPAFIGMFVNAMYNVIDAIFIARGVGTIGVAALSITFPIQLMVVVGAATFGVGGASIISRRLGAKNVEEANKVFGHVVWLIIFFSMLITLSAFIFLEPLLKAFGATDLILPYASDYLRIILLGSIIFSFAMGTNNIVRSEGSAKIAMYTMIIGSIMNVILNPIFIFGLDMGIQGSALATILSQSTSAIWLLRYFLSGKSSLRFNWIGLKPDLHVVKEIILTGLPSFVMMSSTSLMMLSVNWVLVIFGGETQIAIFGIINRLITFTIMPIFGIVQGMQPIIGFNYGAGLSKRVTQTFKFGVYIATTICCLAWIMIMTVPSYLINIFSTEPNVITNGTIALRLIFLVAPLIGLPVVSSGLYQALGKTKKAFILSMSRSMLFLIPLVFTLPHFFNVTGVWIAFALADGLAFFLAGFILLKDRRTLFASSTNDDKKEDQRYAVNQA